MPQGQRSCGSCEYYSSGTCRYLPPTMVHDHNAKNPSGYVLSSWPTVRPSDWCGQYEVAKEYASRGK